MTWRALRERKRSPLAAIPLAPKARAIRTAAAQGGRHVKYLVMDVPIFTTPGANMWRFGQTRLTWVDWCLTWRAAAALSPAPLASPVDVIQLDDVADGMAIVGFLHRLKQLVFHHPSRVVVHSELALQLHRRDACQRSLGSNAKPAALVRTAPRCRSPA